MIFVLQKWKCWAFTNPEKWKKHSAEKTVQRKELESDYILSIPDKRKGDYWADSCSCNGCTIVTFQGKIRISFFGSFVWRSKKSLICNCSPMGRCQELAEIEIYILRILLRIWALPLLVQFLTFARLFMVSLWVRIVENAVGSFTIKFKWLSFQLFSTAFERLRFQIDRFLKPYGLKYPNFCFDILWRDGSPFRHWKNMKKPDNLNRYSTNWSGKLREMLQQSKFKLWPIFYYQPVPPVKSLMIRNAKITCTGWTALDDLEDLFLAMYIMQETYYRWDAFVILGAMDLYDLLRSILSEQETSKEERCSTERRHWIWRSVQDKKRVSQFRLSLPWECWRGHTSAYDWTFRKSWRYTTMLCLGV